MPRVVICTGGTAGHLFPAQQLACELEGFDLLFMGAGLAHSPFFDRTRFAWEETRSGPLSFKGAFDLARGYAKAVGHLRRFRPDLVVGFGSHHSFPPLAAAQRLRIPHILYAADAAPGKVVRLLAPSAVAAGIYFPAAAERLRCPCTLVSMPLRHTAPAEREQLFERWGFEEGRQVVLVFGGSQGARRINELMDECADRLRGRPLQILHMTGDASWTARLAARYDESCLPARVVDFEPNMADLWSVADLAVSRAGASSIAERIEWQVPGVVIPYRHASAHQTSNARYLEEAGGALVAQEEGLDGSGLSERLFEALEGAAAARKRLEALREQPRITLADLVKQELRVDG